METLEIENKVLNGLKVMNHTAEEALKEFLLLNLSEKISEFKNECEFYESKYEMAFKAFEHYLKEKINDENFEEEDDYMAWKYAEESKLFLQEKLDEIK